MDKNAKQSFVIAIVLHLTVLLIFYIVKLSFHFIWRFCVNFTASLRRE